METVKQIRYVFPDGEMESWATLGAITDRSVRVWARLPQGEPVTATLKIDDRSYGKALLEPLPERDYVATADLEADHPAAGAQFVVDVAGFQRTGRLAPAPGEPASFTFAFASCHQPFRISAGGAVTRSRSAGIYPAMANLLTQREARFLLLVGDQVYSDGLPRFSVKDVIDHSDSPPEPAELVDLYRHFYRGYFNEQGFRQLLETIPSCLIWDDHEILDNWGSYLETGEAERRIFQAARQVYRDYQHLHNPGSSLDSAPPYDYQFWYGNVGFLTLDLRTCRNYQSGQVIGKSQWKRLDAFLAQAGQRDVPTVFIIATIPLIHYSPGAVRLLDGLRGNKGENIRDRWDATNFRDDRNRLLDMLFEWQSRQPERQAVLLSGDVHAGAAFQVYPQRGRGKILQWTSSSLTAPGGILHSLANTIGTALVNLGESQCHSVRQGIEVTNNFALVEVSPLEKGHELTLRIYGYRSRKGRLRSQIRVTSRPHTAG